ncbi:hypothetical protein [Actinocorallia populi]|uniref:hypothetical protein n=1 Tax=Actinocorallia populi TaxID=2079200 RepID=UPI001300B0E1|nr:hypothetical protein [Actinocorallia populi]
MRRSIRRTPKEVNRRLRFRTRGVTGAMHNSSMPGLRRPMGRKPRAAVTGALAKSQLKSRARTGVSRARTGASQVQTKMHRTHTGMNQAQTGATKAVAWMIPASIAARRMASHRMTAARGWTAPRIERAAVYFNGSMAPKIGSALSGTAAWIEPAKRRRNTRNTMLGTLAACAAGATVAMMMTRRRHQMEHLLEPEESLESERHRQEQTLSGSYSPSAGQNASYGGGSVSGTRGVGGIAPE